MWLAPFPTSRRNPKRSFGCVSWMRHPLHSPSTLLHHAFDFGIACLYRRRRYCSVYFRPFGCVLWRYGPWGDLMRSLGPARNQSGSRLAPELRSSNPTLFILTCTFPHNFPAFVSSCPHNSQTRCHTASSTLWSCFREG